MFSVDNAYIYNRNQQVMPNGNLIGAGGNLQPSFVVKNPGNDSIYYLFTMDEMAWSVDPDPKGLLYSVIDMDLDGGLGDIPPGQKGIVVPGAEITAEMLTGTRAQNNRDAWIVARKYQNSNEYLTYHVTSAGIDLNPVISNSLVTLIFPWFVNNPEMIRFSPDGHRMVAVYDTINEICNFNFSTGEITPMFCFHTGAPNFGTNFSNAEFSVDNRFLYIYVDAQGNNTTRIYQYDASKTDSAQFKQTETMICQHDYQSALQRGPDNRIYFSRGFLDSLDVINHPSAQGLACNYQRAAVFLDGYYSRNGLIQQFQRYYAYIHDTGHCQGLPVYFTSTIWPKPDSIHWDFGDPASGPENYSYIQNPAHTYLVPGTYNITFL